MLRACALRGARLDVAIVHVTAFVPAVTLAYGCAHGERTEPAARRASLDRHARNETESQAAKPLGSWRRHVILDARAARIAREEAVGVGRDDARVTRRRVAAVGRVRAGRAHARARAQRADGSRAVERPFVGPGRRVVKRIDVFVLAV